MRPTALVVAAAIAGILLFLLATASANTPLFARNYTLLLILNGVIAVGLASLVFVQLRGLWREYRARRFGSRLKLRLMAIFAAMAVVPGVLVYAVSLQFAVKSIDSWFNVRVDAALESGLQLGRSSLDMLLGQLADKAERMVEELELAPQVRSTLLNHLRERVNVESATVFSSSGKIVATSDTEIDSLVPERPSVAQLRQARQTQGYRAVEGQAPDGLDPAGHRAHPFAPSGRAPALAAHPVGAQRLRRPRGKRRDRASGLPGAVPGAQRPQAHLHPHPHPHPAAGPVCRRGRGLRAHPSPGCAALHPR
jgi:hypothetical protein